ncbi:hypothetical protein J6I90_06600 [Pseudidiomarina sp. 1APP75-32.1]|uniref:Uncharacterized protein n=1 Tax=Pseudidiomarina terrestris TaxID=2820060 RepID=A0AAW7R178_9GAMM|nr:MULTISPECIES: hypothetical protein [unclassified Pseudidiomarina]MDN7124546.1 hypothetical protein [Pseudidiomarina sp. 1APP75-32.1]MDN7129163.1 hypothetical protein [Pseudidiomarina sp. 1APR75-15]
MAAASWSFLGGEVTGDRHRSFEYMFEEQNYMAYFNLEANQRSPLFVPLNDYPRFQEISNEPNAYLSTLIIEAPGSDFNYQRIYKHPTMSFGLLPLKAFKRTLVVLTTYWAFSILC